MGCDIITGGDPGFGLTNAQDIKIRRSVDGAEQTVTIVSEQHTRWQAVQGKQG